MPKVKNSTAKKSKQLVSSKKFSLNRLQILLIILVLSVIGVVLVFQSHAAAPPTGSSIGVYAYNSTNKYGAAVHNPDLPVVIGHHGGGTQVDITAGQGSNPNANLTYWAGTKGGLLNAVGTGRMWFGPYTLVEGDGRKAHICWEYAPPDQTAATVRFEVTYNNGQNYIYPTAKQAQSQHIKAVYPFPSQPGGQSMLHLQQFCINPVLAAPIYNNFEIRAELLNAGSKPTDAFRLYRTTWQISG